MREPNKVQIGMIEQARSEALVVAHLLRLGGYLTENDEVIVAAEFEADMNAVIGNRSGSSAVSWSDVRLIMAATLRRCLKILGETE